jgi:putative heme-binding domain-containing protein
VAPNGSLIVADWYDPGVGGHHMGDIDKGRLFRVAPPKTPYKSPRFDFDTPKGAAAALKNPNVATRYLAWTALHKMQASAEPVLKSMFERDENPRFRARALWLLGNIRGKGPEYVAAALRDENADIRIAGCAWAGDKLDVLPLVKQLALTLRRKFGGNAVALRHNSATAMPALWAELASQHAAQDRWSLEALGIAADKRWDDCLAAWQEKVGDGWNTPSGRDILWRSRAARTPELLARIISDAGTSRNDLPRYLRAFDFLDDATKQPVLDGLAFHSADLNSDRGRFVAQEALLRLKDTNVAKAAGRKSVLNRVLDHTRGTETFLELVRKYDVRDRNSELVALAQERPDQDVGVQAIRILLARKDTAGIEQGLVQQDVPLATKTLQALGNSQEGGAVDLLWIVADDAQRPIELRREAVRGLARFKNAAQKLLDRAEKGKLDESLREVAAASLHPAAWDDVKQRAVRVFPPPPSRNAKPLSPLADLVGRRGDVARGRLLFNTTGDCAKCHVVDGIGKEVGPNLTEIGDKLSRLAFYESVVYPRAGISHNDETHVVVLGNGTVQHRLRTPESITLKGSDAIERKILLSEVEEMRTQNVSLMPADLQKTLTEEELVDVVEYLTTLKKRIKAAGG